MGMGTCGKGRIFTPRHCSGKVIFFGVVKATQKAKDGKAEKAEKKENNFVI